jgi:hypothetical protein
MKVPGVYLYTQERLEKQGHNRHRPIQVFCGVGWEGVRHPATHLDTCARTHKCMTKLQSKRSLGVFRKASTMVQ